MSRTLTIDVWPWGALGVAVAIYLMLLLALLALGKPSQARALAGFIPDCIVLLRRLIADPRVPRRRKFALVLLVGYLVLPIDLVPDFVPVVGQLDDVLVAALALRYALGGAGEALLREHWPGPGESLALVLRVARSGRGA